jgi:hypothetical protein
MRPPSMRKSLPVMLSARSLARNSARSAIYKGITVMNTALGNAACADAMFAGNPGSILASCLSPKDMIDDFGSPGLLVAPLAAVGGLANFFASEFQGLHDIPARGQPHRIRMALR